MMLNSLIDATSKCGLGAGVEDPDVGPTQPRTLTFTFHLLADLSGSTDDRMNVFPGGRLVAGNIPILTLIRNVYRVHVHRDARWAAAEGPGANARRASVRGLIRDASLSCR